MPDIDWEMSEDFYKVDKEKEKQLPSFEDFVKASFTDTLEDQIEPDLTAQSRLEKTVNDVKAVRAAMIRQESTADMAKNLGLDLDYINLILLTIQGGFSEDDDIAIAHLVLME
ncbi:MAG: hypothetical protein ACLRZ7_07685 [Lachnospiraceae bacterium]